MFSWKRGEITDYGVVFTRMMIYPQKGLRGTLPDATRRPGDEYRTLRSRCVGLGESGSGHAAAN